MGAINGVRGITNKLLEEMRRSSTWNLAVERPCEIRIRVDCEMSPNLGLDLKYSPNGGSLLISNIGEGAIKEWNKTAPKQIAPRDRIVEINGRRGTAQDLLEA